MKIIATNLAVPREINWKGKQQVTGIYKQPVKGPVRLMTGGVEGDLIGNKKVHGGEFKACYLFASEHYAYWKSQYPNLEWGWGMFGENLTTEGLLDDDIQVGDVFRIGTSIVQATIPREPCYKLGLKFGDQEIVSAYVDYAYPGAYLKILEEGLVSAGDAIKLLESASDSITIRDLFRFLNARQKDPAVLDALLVNPYMPDYKKEKLKRYIK